jgi:hypothetical protein
MSDVLNSQAPPINEPLGNSEAVRNPDGSIKDTQTEPNPSLKEEKKDEPIIEGKKDEGKKDEVVGAPEKYEAFKVPGDKELSAEIVTAASEVFKKHNLSQEAAQEFVDLWNKNTGDLSDRLDQMVADQRNDWRGQIAKDKTLGNGVDNLSDASKKSIADAISWSGDVKVQTALKEALDLTGAGDHPDIVRAFVAFGKQLGEATAVKGKGPSEQSQTKPGQGRSAAQALYPNLPSSANG